jgi:hypothetical protein
MDASQYKDYVLFMLFIKYISDQYGDSDDFAPPVVIPEGAGFKDMVALKGKSDIGEKINTQVIKPLIDAYAIFQHLMDYWAETMQDDCYLIAADGWKATPQPIFETVKSGKNKGKKKKRAGPAISCPNPILWPGILPKNRLPLTG